jgi:hypothetical protein
MSVNRRELIFAGAGLLCAAALGAVASFAAETGEAEVAAAVEAYRKALLASDRKQFEALCADQMTYGHSSGRVQTKKEFIDEATNGKTVWKSITLTDQTVQLAGDNAMARCVFTGENQSDGKTNTPKFGLLTVWVKHSSTWRLLARQGYKI